MIAVIPVRTGLLPDGAEETIAACGGRGLLIGEGAAEAAAAVSGGTARLVAADPGRFAPGRCAALLAPLCRTESVVVLPASPDGRDLAPRLAALLARPLLAGAVEVEERGARLLRLGGRQLVEVACDGDFVATLLPGSAARSQPRRGGTGEDVTVLSLIEEAGEAPLDAEAVEELDAEAGTVELGEAGRIVAGGAGIATPSAVSDLAAVAGALGASVGATRALTDTGLLTDDRQIGTTGASVAPRVYLAFGISGALQHVAALSGAGHIVSVNLDPACPMMAMADLAIEADAPATLAVLREELSRAG